MKNSIYTNIYDYFAILVSLLETWRNF